MRPARAVALTFVIVQNAVRAVRGQAFEGGMAAALAADDECRAGSADEKCALAALQLRGQALGSVGDKAAGAASAGSAIESLSAAVAAQEEAAAEEMLPYYCVYYPWLPVCTQVPPYVPPPTPVGPGPSPKNRYKLQKPSNAEVKTFYMYRVQSTESYAPMNQDMTNLAGCLWYLHNEIVVSHSGKKGRTGTYFATRKTRIEKFKVQTKATQTLIDVGMNFGVMNPFDSGACTGPFDCNEQFDNYGYTVGCETWNPGSQSNYPHAQWNDMNHYKGAIWYSLPGPCPLTRFNMKTPQCEAAQRGGAGCPAGQEPDGKGDCTYTYEKVGEINIDDLEGITDFEEFTRHGGIEYGYRSDVGVHMTFWNHKKDDVACQARVDKAEKLFKAKYPDMPDLPDPTCDFDKDKFYGRVV